MYVVSFLFHFFYMLTLIPKEYHANHSCCVKCSNYCCNECHCKYWECPSISRFINSCKDCILTPEACCDKWSTHQSKSCSPHERICLSHVFSQSSHVSHESRANNMQQGTSCHEQ